MRHIKKTNGESTVELDRQIDKGVPANKEEATRRWNRFSEKEKVERLLFEKQVGLCCYTELNLTDFAREQGMGYHIEHEKPKSTFPQLTFNFTNLLLCALNDQDLKQFKGTFQFGGHFKKSNYDAQLFISPHDEHCRKFFVYLSQTGEIGPNLSLSAEDQQKATYTIALLNLNAPFLRAERQLWLQELESCLQPLIERGDIDSIKRVAETELLPFKRKHPKLGTNCDQLRKFHSAVREMFGALGESVIQSQNSNAE